MQVNIKRLLSFLVVLAMVLSMVPVTGIPAIEAKAEETESATVKTTVTDNLVFLEGTQTAYCPACKADAEWTEYTGQYADTVLSVTNTPRYHFYLTEDLEYTTNALQTYEHICFHLNGHDVKPAADSTTSARPFSCTQNFDLMGTGTVYGGKVVTANTGTIMAINGGKASATFELHSGTLKNSEGVTAPLLTIGANGGKIYIYGGTINGDGETIYTYGTNETNTSANKGYANVKITGGTVNGDLNIGYKTNTAIYTGGSILTFSGGTVNGAVNMLQGSPATISGNATATSISVATGGKLTVKAGWSGSAVVDFADGPTAAKAVAEGAFTGSLTRPNGDKLVYANGKLKVDTTFDPAAETNYCEACDAYVTWTALRNGETITNASNHYYVAEDMTAKAGSRLIYGADFPNTNICLQLNGKTLTTGSTGSAAIYCSNGADINIMGDGTVINGGTGLLFEAYTSDVFLYGGTYISNNGKNAMNAAGSNTKVYLYNNAKFEGPVDAKAGTITLNDSASIVGLVLNGGTVATAEGWTGSLKTAEGKYYELVDGAWTVVTKTPEWGKFEPEACDGLAYCEHCGEEAGAQTWTALKGKERIGSLGDGKHHHVYLFEDVEVDQGLTQTLSMSAGTSVCLNLNGKNFVNHGRVFTTAGGTLAIMGEGNVSFAADTTFTGADADAYKQALVAGCSGGVYLYGGTYSVTGAALTAGKPTIVASNKVFVKNATVNGYIAANAGSTIKLEGTTVAEDIRITDTGKVVVAAGWSGTASLTVADSAFENGVLTAGSAEGEFTGTLTCNGVELSNQDGTLMADTTFNPDAETNYCRICKEFVAWEALPETVPTIGTDGACLHYYVPADMTAKGAKNAFLYVEDSNGTASNVAPKVCLYLNNKTLTLTQYLYAGFSGVVNVIGDGTMTTTSGVLMTPYTSTLNLYGGTYIAKAGGKALTMGGSGAKVNLYEDAELQGEAALNQGTLTMYGESSANKVVVSGTGKVTLDAGWTGTMVLDASAVAVDGKIPAANAVVTGGVLNGTVTDTNGNVFVYADGQLGINVTFDPEAETSYCEHCGKSVAWTALHNGESFKDLTVGASYHYYVAEDMTAADGAFLPGLGAGTFSLCLNLNGKELTVKGSMWCQNGYDINIMGDGKVINGGTTAMFGEVWTCDLNLYGGTYVDNTGRGIMTMQGGNAKVYLHNDAKLDGLVTVSAGNLYLNDSASVTKLAISGGKTTFKSGWSGSAVVTVDDSLITDGTVNVANAYVEDGAAGTLTDAFGAAITVADHALVMPASTIDPDVFEPWNHNGYAYCDCVVCGAQKLVEWTDLNDYVAKNGNTLYVDGITDTVHFYLSGDLTYTDHVLSTYEHVIFNLNGYDITPVAKEGETAITASYAFSSTQRLVLMNTAEEMSTITGWSTKAGDSSVIWINGGGASGTAYLMDNVTLKTHEDCATDAPVVRIADNGGKFYMEGGIIDASKKVNTDYPCAVYIGGSTTNNAKFYMNGGEIKGGTSVNSAGAVQIGYSGTEAKHVDGAFFYMTNGTISGGNANNGGNILINKNAKEVEITDGTITDGEATLSGGNIYSKGADLTIGEGAVISDGFIPFTNMSTAGTGGGNIWFGDGTLTTSGTITGGKIEKFKGAGGNIFLDNGANGEVHFIMNGGEISGGQIPVGDEAIYEGADPAGQNYGANIRAYNIQEMALLGGTIEGGIGGNPEKAKGRDVYLSCNNIETVLTIGNVTINGAVHLAKYNLILKDAPVITAADGKNGLTAGDGADVLADISGLTEGANVQFSGVTPNAPFTVACDNVDTVKNYITVIDSGATLTTQNNQLILVGVAIVGGEETAWFADNAAAVAAYTAEDYAAGKYIQLGLDTALALAGGEYLIDLAGNGDAAEVAITGTGIVHLFDSANADFDGFRTATLADTITLAERDHTVIVDEEAVRFIIVTDADGKTSAHALDMAITGVNLRTDAAGLYYSANYNCDETLAEYVTAYGVILSLNDMPGAVKTSDDQRTELTDFAPGAYATSSSVSGIFKDTRTAAKNAEYGKMKIYANAYIQLDVDGDGVAETLVADTVNAGKKAGNAWSLHDVLTTIDQNWAAYAKDQEAVKAFYDQWYDLGMSAYADDFTNIDIKVDVEGGEGEGVTPEDTDVDVEV